MLCAYYADCVTAAEHPTDYLPLSAEHDAFVVAHPPPGWLEAATFALRLDPRRDLPFKSRLLTRAQFDETLYIGYPCAIIKGARSNERLAIPIFTIPVEAKETGDSWTITPDREAAQLNQQWLNYQVPKEEHKRLLARFHNADGTPNFAVACALLGRRAGLDFDPNRPEAFLPAGHGLVNVAVLAVGMRLRYSKTLRRELLQIREEADEVLDRTALAYVFRNPPLPNDPCAEPRRLPHPAAFLPTNLEQQRALIEALAKPCTKIQGPPGTGKSQAAVNLLLNLAYRGQSVLFTSRNHAAIHAIDDKVRKAFAADPALAETARQWVQYCSTDDGDAAQSWQTADPEAARSLAIRILEEHSETELNAAIETFACGLEDLGFHWQDLERRQKLTRELESAESRAQTLRDCLRVPEGTNAAALAAQAERLAYVPRGPIARFLWWLTRGARRVEDLERALRARFPGVSAPPDRAFLRERLLKQAQLLKAAQAAQVDCLRLRAETSALPPYQTLFAATHAAQRCVAEALPRAMLAQICRRTAGFDPDVAKRIAQLCRRQRLHAHPVFATTVQPQLHTEVAQAFAELTRLYPIWVCTLLSLTRASPCSAALFDRVVIDEAAQCDVPPLIPALFRAKALTVIGDPQQFPPVIALPEARHLLIQRRHHLEDQRLALFDYASANAYSVVQTPATLLVEHFRCAPDIAAYCSEAFYDNRLVIRTEAPKGTKENGSPDAPDQPSPFARCLGRKADLDWIDVQGSWDDEAAALEAQLTRIADNAAALPRPFTIGVITPFRDFAGQLRAQLRPLAERLGDALSLDRVNTVNAFQGGECDLIFILLGLNDAIAHGKQWYATDGAHAYIYNVAVSRARVGCFIIGDREHARASHSPALAKLAAPRPHRQPRGNKIGPGEQILAEALRRLGLDPQPQLPLGRRWLDLALTDSKIDIEVDGISYHTNSRGERKQDDLFRDAEVASHGYRPFRVWHHEVIHDPDAIARRIHALHLERLRAQTAAHI